MKGCKVQMGMGHRLKDARRPSLCCGAALSLGTTCPAPVKQPLDDSVAEQALRFQVPASVSGHQMHTSRSSHRVHWEVARQGIPAEGPSVL